MFMPKKILLAFLLLPLTAYADKNASQISSQQVSSQQSTMQKVLSQYGMQIEEISPAPLAGLFEVVTNRGDVYANQDASYFIYGQMIHTNGENSENLTDLTMAKRNQRKFNEANVEQELIVYPAKNEQYVINVFSDPTCGYCRKLHDEMKSYNDAGITVRYLAFPRGGSSSPTVEALSAVWCAKDQRRAMDLAKSSGYSQKNKNCVDLVRRHMALGVDVGVTGTPALLLQDGTLVSGYVPAPRLLEMLKEHAKKAS